MAGRNVRTFANWRLFPFNSTQALEARGHPKTFGSGEGIASYAPGARLGCRDCSARTFPALEEAFDHAAKVGAPSATRRSRATRFMLNLLRMKRVLNGARGEMN